MFTVKKLAGLREGLENQEVGVKLLVAVDHESPENHEEIWQPGDLGNEVEDGLNPSFIDLINRVTVEV